MTKTPQQLANEYTNTQRESAKRCCDACAKIFETTQFHTTPAFIAGWNAAINECANICAEEYTTGIALECIRALKGQK